MQVMNAERASYGIGDYVFAISQLAQTTLRSEIGKIELDKTFEERAVINLNVVKELDLASEPWGVKVLRYEIKNINPPDDVLSASGKRGLSFFSRKVIGMPRSIRRKAKKSESFSDPKLPCSSKSMKQEAKRRLS